MRTRVTKTTLHLSILNQLEVKDVQEWI